MMIKDRIKLWKQPPEGVLTWINDIQPRIKGRNLKPIVFQPLDWQKDFLLNALAVENGEYKHTDIISVLPKRHGKSVLMALICLYNFTLAMPGSNIKVVANSVRQTKAVGFGLLKYIVRNTPFLYQQIGENNLQGENIYYDDLDGHIQVVSSAENAMHGEQVTTAWISELHTASSLDAYFTLSSSMGDTANAMLLCDTNQGTEGSPVDQVEKMSKDNPSMYYFSLEYKNLEDALKKQPHWLGEKWLRSQYTKSKSIPGHFERLHLNKRTESEDNFFNTKDIKKAQSSYKNGISKDDFETMIAAGKKYVVGVGLDRARGGSKHGDQTVLTTVARTVSEDGEPYYYVLDQRTILMGRGVYIKKAIIELDGKYGLKNSIFEAYDVSDITYWMHENGYSCTAVHPTTITKTSAYEHLATLLIENRIAFPTECKKLIRQLSQIEYQVTDKGNIKIGTRTKRDDFADSLTWAIWSLKSEDTVVYELSDIVCNSKSRSAPFCYLRNGSYVLQCANQCYAHKQVRDMFKQYMKSNPESELTIQDFYKRLVRVNGVVTYNAI